MEFFNNLLANGGQYIEIAAYVVAAASILANITPTDTDNKIVNVVGKAVNFLAAYWRDPDAAAKAKAAADATNKEGA